MTARRRAKSEDSPPYMAPSAACGTQAQDNAIAIALRILAERLAVKGAAMDSPQTVRNFCALNLGALPHEVFGVLFLDAQHRLIEFRDMFRGTLTQTSVYPREIVKEALTLNAAAVILTHNHPSGTVEPSQADRHLTKVLRDALTMVDCRVLDHVIVAGAASMSFAERGLI
jgi:DNA repair protein RadC